MKVVLGFLAVVGLLACDQRSVAHADSSQPEYVGVAPPGADSSVPATRYRTRIAVDVQRGQVRELRRITTALGTELEPEISVWGPGHTGFRPDTRSACQVFDSQNFVCRVWPNYLGSTMPSSSALWSELRMDKGVLSETTAGETIHYTLRASRVPD